MNDLRVLLVENDKYDHQIIKRVLQRSKWSFQLSWAQDSAEAIAAIQQDSFDVILMDFMLQDTDGLALHHEMKKAGLDTATIFVTGQGNEEVAVAAMQAGVHDYIVKDVGGNYLESLPNVIRRASQQWHDQKARIRAEASLRENEERHRSTLASMDDIVVILDKNGIVLDGYCPPGQNDAPVSCKDIEGKPVAEVFPGEFSHLLPALIDEVKNSHLVCEQDNRWAHDDRERWSNVKASARYASEGEFAGTTLVIRDITQRNLVQRELQREKELLEQQYHRQKALAQLGLSLSETPDLSTVLSHIAHLVTEFLPASAGASIILWDADKRAFVVSASTVARQPPETAVRRVRRHGGNKMDYR